MNTPTVKTKFEQVKELYDQDSDKNINNLIGEISKKLSIATNTVKVYLYKIKREAILPKQNKKNIDVSSVKTKFEQVKELYDQVSDKNINIVLIKQISKELSISIGTVRPYLYTIKRENYE